MNMRTTIMVAVTVGLLATSMPAEESPATSPSFEALVDLLDEHPQGLPFHRAKAMDPAFAGPLLEMLRRPEHEDRRAHVVFLLGLIGDERAVEPVVNLLLSGYEGEVDRTQLSVLITAMNALGDLAGAGSDQALDFLLKHRFPAAWADEKLRWKPNKMSQESQNRLFSFQTLVALGRSGRPEALVVLREMHEAEDLDQELRVGAKAAVDLHHKIQEKGLRAALDPRFDPDEVLKVGRHVYDLDVRQYLRERRPHFLSQFLAEHGQPVLVVEHGGTPDRDDYLLKKLSKEPGGLETQRQILLDIEASEEVKRGTPVVTIADDGAAAVAIPLENSQPLVKRHFPQGAKGVTVDAEGRLVIHMIRSKDNRWYWNPFGW